MWSKDVVNTTAIIIKILKYERILFTSFVFFADSSTSSVSGTNKVLIDKLLRDSYEEISKNCIENKNKITIKIILLQTLFY